MRPPVRAGDVGRVPRAAWQVWAWSGQGWLVCAVLLVVLYWWENRVITRPAAWYEALFRSVHNVPGIPAIASAFLVAWLAQRIRTRSRNAAEPMLKLAWFVMAVYLIAVGAALLRMMM